MSEKTFSIFEYLYRDASNYKSWGIALLEGQLSTKEVATMVKHFDSGLYFVAEQIGIPTLYGELLLLSGGCSTVDDHSFHEFYGLHTATTDDVNNHPTWGQASELLSRIQGIKYWNAALCSPR